MHHITLCVLLIKRSVTFKVPASEHLPVPQNTEQVLCSCQSAPPTNCCVTFHQFFLFLCEVSSNAFLMLAMLGKNRSLCNVCNNHASGQVPGSSPPIITLLLVLPVPCPNKS